MTTEKTSRIYAFTDADVRAKALSSMQALKEAGAPLGRRPSLTDADLAEILRLRSLGLGTVSIGKVVRTLQKKSGRMTVTSPRTIRKVLAGEYVSREAQMLLVSEAKKRIASKTKGKEND